MVKLFLKNKILKNDKDGEALFASSSLKFNKVLDSVFKKILLGAALCVVVIVVFMLITLIISSLPSIKKFGATFFVNNVWDYRTETFGAWAFIIGTVETSFLALAISLPFSISISILLGVYLKQGVLSNFIKTMTELLAGIPSVIYGFWGFFFLGPIIRDLAIRFGYTGSTGYGVLTSAIVLSIMIIPYTASMGREVIELVPNYLIEGAYGLGATRLEVVTKVMIPYSFSGIFAGVILSLGRALGETMAVTMLIGNTNGVPKSVFDTGNTIASVIANQFGEAGGIQMSTLIELGFVLMVITLVVNLIGKYIIKKFTME